MLPQVSINYLAHEIDFLRPKFEKIFYLWREGKINNGETCSLYLLTFLISRFGNHTFGGFRKRKSGLTISPQTTRQSISKDQLLSLLNIPLRVIRQIPTHFDLIDILELFHLIHCSPKINDSLIKFILNQWNFLLITHIPSVDEVLDLQSRGLRPVTMMIDYSLMKNYIHDKKDAPNFLLHDLAHGERFFYQEDQYYAQVGLYDSLKKYYKLKKLSPIFEQDLKKNNSFIYKLEYALADMNTHPLHLLQYLKAIWAEAFLSDKNKKKKLQEIENVFLNIVNWPIEIKSIFQKINTRDVQTCDYLTMQSFLISQGKSILNAANPRSKEMVKL